KGFLVDALHGDMVQKSRDTVMKSFKTKAIKVLVTTDVAARGIDAKGVDLVINYDIPSDEKYYVHRIGRTGRAGKEGRAVTFVMNSDERRIFEINSYTGKEFTFKKKPSKRLVIELKPAFEEKLSIRPKIKEDKGALLSKDIMKLHINAGKKTKMRPVDIVGTLCSIDGVESSDIGVISVLD
ncbi:MAG: helicase-related protein, partial [Cetobacterium sp.]|uniref:helicase-related protein n=1 Tax=Cetobacterium sp. TaxID=2071632 RepID=UPI002FC76072